ncbi:transposase [Streptomyces sp. NPDC059893]|uniref:transposase n=1 Tax=Streptomyces sp. NPDC059893 TaxID=3346990 RepID=UPI003653218B
MRTGRGQRREGPRPFAGAPPAKSGPLRLASSFKGVWARSLRQKLPAYIRKYLWGLRFWSPSHFAASCGGAPHGIKYIKNRKRPG